MRISLWGRPPGLQPTSRSAWWKAMQRSNSGTWRSRADLEVCPTKTLGAIVLLLAAAAFAQSPRGALTGMVKGSSGAVVPGVQVTVTNAATGSVLTVESQANGAYFAPGLLAGDYQVSISRDGFKRVALGPLKVDVSTTATQDI